MKKMNYLFIIISTMFLITSCGFETGVQEPQNEQLITVSGSICVDELSGYIYQYFREELSRGVRVYDRNLNHVRDLIFDQNIIIFDGVEKYMDVVRDCSIEYINEELVILFGLRDRIPNPGLRIGSHYKDWGIRTYRISKNKLIPYNLNLDSENPNEILFFKDGEQFRKSGLMFTSDLENDRFLFKTIDGYEIYEDQNSDLIFDYQYTLELDYSNYLGYESIWNNQFNIYTFDKKSKTFYKYGITKESENVYKSTKSEIYFEYIDENNEVKNEFPSNFAYMEEIEFLGIEDGYKTLIVTTGYWISYGNLKLIKLKMSESKFVDAGILKGSGVV